MSHDVHIRGGLVVDGTGAPARRADVAIDGGRVVEVAERLEGSAGRTIEADGSHRVSRLRRPPHPLRHPGLLGSDAVAVAAARRHHRHRRQLRVLGGADGVVRGRLPDADAGPGRGHAARLVGRRHRLGLGLVRLVPGPTGRHGDPQPRLPGRALGHPAGDDGRGRQRADRHRRRGRRDATAARARASTRARSGSRRRGRRPTSTATGCRCRRASPTSPSCSSCATRSAATRARRSSSSPASATSPKPRAS